jgi:hypothetical protein
MGMRSTDAVKVPVVGSMFNVVPEADGSGEQHVWAGPVEGVLRVRNSHPYLDVAFWGEPAGDTWLLDRTGPDMFASPDGHNTVRFGDRGAVTTASLRVGGTQMELTNVDGVRARLAHLL